FWLKKPYTDWGTKEAAKLLENSPWARQVSVGIRGPDMSMDGGGRGRGRNRGGAPMGDMTAANSAEAGLPDSGSRGRSGSQMESQIASMTGGGASILVTVRWQSALPVRQAIVVTKLGREKVESDDARKFLSQVLPGYVVGLIGLPARMGRI